MGLDSFTPEQLQAELSRRGSAAAFPPPTPPPTPLPTPLPNPDFTTLIKTVTEGVADTIKYGYQDKNLEGYIYEAAIEAVYGQSYWTWRRAQRW